MGPRLGPDPSDIEYLLVPPFFEAGYHRFREVSRHDFDEDRLQRFALSSGYAPRPSQDRRRRGLREAITSFVATHGQDGVVSLAFETVAFLGCPRRPRT